MSKHDIVLRYTPADPGLYFHGVPQRDLTAEDLMGISPATLRDLTESGVYTKAEKPTAEPPKAPAKDDKS